MSTGYHTPLSPGRIAYKELRKISPEAVLEYLRTNHDIAQNNTYWTLTQY